eukprot:CAMPEP_0118695424 /NCGR_PEP_ID=MMETSP0800-20121206/13173_1 /TAXON_ID=210618 ORGANISM="Striatella unipunctata, Strain CCMP2910" /NCGR_SAMPLE_ID=MMETSP0800 /ASSEMBLY_ACC=CAM_ASM_000638 /LENGTH=159 /DNA_ID=CAMNT_0006594203 /DNA_START=291 /DNA_END=767 /DNA_ORIENTATION=-
MAHTRSVQERTRELTKCARSLVEEHLNPQKNLDVTRLNLAVTNFAETPKAQTATTTTGSSSSSGIQHYFSRKTTTCSALCTTTTTGMTTRPGVVHKISRTEKRPSCRRDEPKEIKGSQQQQQQQLEGIDPLVLAELPPSIVEEIMRDYYKPQKKRKIND